MKEIRGNLFDMVGADAICVTTNGFVTKQGLAVMGMGCAKTAAKKWPGIKRKLGALLELHGNRPLILGTARKLGALPESHGNQPLILGTTSVYKVVSFPVKPVTTISDGVNGDKVVNHAKKNYFSGQVVPGFHAVADIEIIKDSAEKLVEMADKFGWRQVVIPRPGCGAGELDWNDVRPHLEEILDDRFEIITF